jgi:hypothetical protein
MLDTPATPGVRSAVALTTTTFGPSLGADDTPPAQILAGGQGGGLDAGVITHLASATTTGRSDRARDVRP